MARNARRKLLVASVVCLCSQLFGGKREWRVWSHSLSVMHPSAIAVPSQCHRSAIAVPSRCHHSAITVPSQRPRGAIIAPSRCHHCAIIVPTLCHRGAIERHRNAAPVPSQYHHSPIAVLLQYYCIAECHPRAMAALSMGAATPVPPRVAQAPCHHSEVPLASQRSADHTGVRTEDTLVTRV